VTTRQTSDKDVQQDVSDDYDKNSGFPLHSDKGKDEEVAAASEVIQPMRHQEIASLIAMAHAPPHEVATTSSVAAETAASPNRSLSSLPFPAQLMNLLQRNVAPGTLWFLDGGEAIGFDEETIVDKVLNEHFRGMKFSSFVRNLNRW
jgi:HSF-type DNA-binding